MRHRGSATAGFTLVELVVVLALTVPLLLVLGGATRTAIGSFTVTERSAKATEAELRALGEIDRVLRMGRLQTLRTVAVQTDVQQSRAAAIGDWFPMPIGEPRTQLDVQSLVGDTSPALLIPTRLSRLLFVRDPGELAGGADGDDDDGDRLIDEGELRVQENGATRVVLRGLEGCTFERVGNSVFVTLRTARPGHGNAVQRSTLTHVIVVNNP